jgi:hypothetical protein
MFHRTGQGKSLMALATLVAMADPDITVVMDEAHKLRKPRVIDPPPKYRNIRIPGSYDDNVVPATVRDPEALSVADMKRARKAAKRLKEQQR